MRQRAIVRTGGHARSRLGTLRHRGRAGMGCWLTALALLALLGPLQPARAAPPTTITLVPSLPSGQPVGTPITWTASAPGLSQPVYRFSVGLSGQPPSLVRDFSPKNSVVWAPLQEGTYVISATVSTTYTASVQNLRTVSATYAVVSRVTGTTPVVSPTANPLVALFSAPPCAGGVMEVAFRAASATSFTYTNAKPCIPGLSRNFYVAGMLPSTQYDMLDVVINGTTITKSGMLTFMTGALPTSLTFPTFSVPMPPTAQSDLAENVLWNTLVFAPPTIPDPTATDLQGRIVWYYGFSPADVTGAWATNLEPGGTTLVIATDSTGNQVLRQIDLAGNTLQETSVAEVNAQLAAQGKEIIYDFHHDAVLLPNGDTAVLGYTLQYVDLNGTPTPYLGDMLIVLDRNWQVTWTWDAFNYLDTGRLPILGETCSSDYPNCPLPASAQNAVDWLHTNTIAYSPSDGNIILSMRNQDWVVKIAYRNGAGDGHVIWRLGLGGDFSIVSTDPYPWFSHQHDVHYIDSTTLALFDNGNTRCTDPNGNYIQGCDSRGQVLALNERTMVVTPTVNVDLGNYSPALGSAERESNGNYDFTSGFQMPPFPGPRVGQSIEVLPGGAKVYVQQVSSAEYRSFRVADLYHGTNPPCTACPPPH